MQKSFEKYNDSALRVTGEVGGMKTDWNYRGQGAEAGPILFRRSDILPPCTSEGVFAKVSSNREW